MLINYSIVDYLTENIIFINKSIKSFHKPNQNTIFNQKLKMVTIRKNYNLFEEIKNIA